MSKATETKPDDAKYEAWRAEVDKMLKGADFEKRLVARTLEGIDVKPLYTARDWPAEQDPGGFPGGPPYRRGALAIGRSGEGREMRPRYDNPDADKLRVEIAEDLARGAKSLWLGFDLGVRSGRSNIEPPEGTDPFGAPCLTATQLGALLAEVPLPRIALSLDAGGNALAVAACFVHAASARGVAPTQLSGWLNADPLGALARDGELPYSLDSARAQLVALATWALQHAPGLRAATVSAVPYHDAGAHAAQELAYALATGVSYLRWLCDSGLDVKSACSQLAFSLSVGTDFFMEVAKLRAMRQCWANVVAECGGSASDQVCVLHATTSTRTKTERDPWVNLLRETTEAFAASAGGADAVTIGGFDRLFGPSEAFARRIAGNAQVILDEEAHVGQVADPAGGAWYVEALTDELAQRAWALFQRIEAEGGMQSALQAGRIAKDIAEVAQARDRDVAKRKQAITGVSEYANIDEEAVARPIPNRDAIFAQRRSALAAASRDEAVAKPLMLARAAGHGMVEAAIEVAGRGANLGQISCALADPEAPAKIAVLPLRRPAHAYERLRDACDAHARKTGRRPSVFLCNLGKIPEHKARAQFATGCFNAGGLMTFENDGFESADAAAQAYAESGAELAVICGSDAAYALSVAEYAPLLVARGAKRVVLAGRPAEHEASYRSAGVTDFVFTGCNVVDSLSAMLTATGVLP